MKQKTNNNNKKKTPVTKLPTTWQEMSVFKGILGGKNREIILEGVMGTYRVLELPKGCVRTHGERDKGSGKCELSSWLVSLVEAIIEHRTRSEDGPAKELLQMPICNGRQIKCKEKNFPRMPFWKDIICVIVIENVVFHSFPYSQCLEPCLGTITVQ